MTQVRFGWAQVVLGLFLFGCAALLGGVAWAFAWPAFAVLAVGVGYLGMGPRVFAKRDDGSLAPASFALLLPYHVVAYLRMHWDAWRHREDAWNQVADGLFLGRRTPVHALPPATRVVVDVTAELPRIAGLASEVRYVVLPTLDATAPAYEPFARLARELAPVEGPIFVHCAAGHGRSATFCAALLVARGLASGADDAEATLKRARPLVHLHRAQRALVDRFAAELASSA